jgi:hypothetical protein
MTNVVGRINPRVTSQGQRPQEPLTAPKVANRCAVMFAQDSVISRGNAPRGKEGREVSQIRQGGKIQADA